MKVLLFILITILKNSSSAPTKERDASCGYASCPSGREGLINIHLVPHTHDDVGWLKTVDEYYYGANNTIQSIGIQYVLDSVVQELSKDTSRRFIYVETGYFWKWWLQQNDNVKDQVKSLVANGQLEFMGGAWSMNDEAATHYQSIIDQFTWGLRQLNDTFGGCGRPKIGWQIDPFGHSREMASLFAQMGYDALLFGRIDFEDKQLRFESKQAEMIWQGSQNLNADMFSTVLYDGYGAPPGFCWDIRCNDEPMIDDTDSPLYNIDKRVEDFLSYVENMAKVYNTQNIIVTMGSDFHYQNANMWYKNMDKLILYANQRQSSGSPYHLFYSTPSCYIKAVYDTETTFTEKTDDFFPYGSDAHSYWTGYFISRPTLKRFERQTNNFLQICKQLYVLANLGDAGGLDDLRGAMGVMQHHDAITGTEKQHVANDYARLLTEAIAGCGKIVKNALTNIITNEEVSTNKKSCSLPQLPELLKNVHRYEISLQTCWLANISSCTLPETESEFMVTIYNPLSRPVTKYVRFPVTGSSYTVLDSLNNSIPVDLIPTPTHILNVPGRVSQATVELIFEALDVPPLGFKSFTVLQKSGNDIISGKDISTITSKDGLFGFGLDETSGKLKNVTFNGVTMDVKQEFLYYEGYVDQSKDSETRSSGAYVFRPVPEQSPIEIAEKVDFKVFKGDIVQEVQQTFNDWVTQTIRIYEKENLIEFDWVVGPIPNQGYNGKEVITRFTTNLNSKSTFYTDSNGREMLQRIRNARPTWTPDLLEPVSGNYYPITSKITLVDEDNDLQVSVLTERAQGGTSLQDGRIDIMVHRACLRDDGFGVGEALNETAFGQGLVARGSHFLVIGPQSTKVGEFSTTAHEREIAQRKVLDSWILFSQVFDPSFLKQFSGLETAIPSNVQILTLEPWKDKSVLIRLEHIFEKNEDPILSQPVTVDISEIFTDFTIISLNETTLAGNQWLEESSRLHFLNKNFERSNDNIKVQAPDDYQITLNPMEIRTFIVEIERK